MDRTLIASIVFCSWIYLACGDIKPCPFNEKVCNCTFYPPAETTFTFVRCIADNLPFFTAPPNVTYTVTGDLQIFGNVSYIPARHFAVFKSIGSLYLIRTNFSTTPYQQWHELAFDEVQIPSLVIRDLADVIPPTPALRRLGARCLKSLRVEHRYIPVPIQLDDNIFEAFPTLETLSIGTIKITKISPNAFVGLERSLISLVLSDTSLTEVPFHSLSSLKKLENLYLQSNNLQKPIDDGQLDHLPPTLTHLNLDNNGLRSFPKRVIQSSPKLATLYLQGNLIASIDSQDLANNRNLEKIYLNSQPFVNIGYGAFLPLTASTYFYFAGTEVKSLDLSAFSSMKNGGVINLSYMSKLKMVIVTDTKTFPVNARIDLGYTGLEAIDPRIGELLDNKLNVSINFGSSQNLACKNLNWMAVHAYCTKRLTIDGFCADVSGQSISNYLKPFAPNPCPAATRLPILKQ